jgi:DNA repair protein RecN (Recombination protein N)
MLKRLYISNFALINEMDVTFPGELTVITGETGAGKSIFLEALGLALGNRAELAALKNKAKKCIIEAEFDVSSLDLQSFFEENELEPDSTLILRREINADGKSRSFLNDSVVGLNVLKLLSEKLIDIHSQHQTLLLNQANFQLEVLDAFAGSLQLVKEYRLTFNKLSALKNSLRSLQENEAEARKQLDYYSFLFKELEETEIRTGFVKTLEDESSALENAGDIKTALGRAAVSINGGEENLLSGLSQVKQALQSVSKFGKNYEQFFERINSAYIELKELATELEDAEESANVNPGRLEEVNASLDQLNRLFKKHNVNSEEELLAAKAQIEEKLLQFGSLETEIEKTQKQIDTLSQSCKSQAQKLSALRSKAIFGIEKQVKESLADLSMENAQFKIELNALPETGPNGIDQIRFLFSANKGASLNELHKVASGGELSRLMLSLKALLATKKKLPTIIFDEIDTGVSGDVADKIGNILLRMGRTMQVITITHLPQIASKGRHHLFVYKKDDEDKTISYIREITNDERVTEIAKMLSTGKPSQSALVNAKELLDLN